MSDEERALFEEALSEEARPVEFGSEDDLALALEMLEDAEYDAVDEDEAEQLAAIREEIEANATADPSNASFEAAGNAVGAPANCAAAKSLAKTASGTAGIAEIHAKENWQDWPSGPHRADCFIKTILMDSKMDVAYESMKTADTSINAWVRAYLDINAGLAYADEAVQKCGAANWGGGTASGVLAYKFSGFTKTWGGSAKTQLGNCTPAI